MASESLSDEEEEEAELVVGEARALPFCAVVKDMSVRTKLWRTEKLPKFLTLPAKLEGFPQSLTCQS